MDTLNHDEGHSIEIDSTDPNCPVVVLRGDIDLDTAPAIRERLVSILSTPPTRITFDLSAVNFMDSSGISVLVNARKHVPAVSIRSPSPSARLVIDATGLAELLPTEP